MRELKKERDDKLKAAQKEAQRAGVLDLEALTAGPRQRSEGKSPRRSQ